MHCNKVNSVFSMPHISAEQGAAAATGRGQSHGRLEQAAAAAESLEEQAQQMVQVVTRFRLEETALPQKGVPEKKARRMEARSPKTTAKKNSQPVPKKLKKTNAPALPAPESNEQDDDWKEF